MTELKPCPFCGGDAEVIDLGDPDDDSYAHCTKCRVQQIADFTAKEAALRWNTRASTKGMT